MFVESVFETLFSFCTVNGSDYIESCRLYLWCYRFCGKLGDAFRQWKKCIHFSFYVTFDS